MSSSTEQINSPVTDAMKKRHAIIISTFKDNAPLLNTIRALFFGLELNADEKQAIKGLSSEVKDCIRRLFAPTLSDYREGPIGFAADQWTNIDSRIMGAPEYVIVQAIKSQEEANKLVEHAMALLNNPDGEKLDLTPRISSDGTNTLTDDVFLLARNQFIRVVNAQCQNIWTMAHQQQETPKEMAKRIEMDSAQ